MVTIPLPEGPFESEQEVTRHPAVQEIYEAANLAGASHRMLCGALSAAGVEPGAYEHRVVLWLAGFEPQACAAVAALITRAHQAGATGTADAGVSSDRDVVQQHDQQEQDAGVRAGASGLASGAR